jgi:glutathione synthase/RimK-type ligase-like ATP-grasp enzyme
MKYSRASNASASATLPYGCRHRVRVSGTITSSIDQLRALDAQLALAHDDPDLRFDRARALDDLGRTGDAMHAYRDVLLVAPQHFGALTNLGTLFIEQDRPEGARVCFAAALAAAPGDPLAHLNHAILEQIEGADDAARATYEGVLTRFADDAQARAHAHNGLARLHERRGDAEAAERHRALALAQPIVWTFPYRGNGTPIRVLVLTSARGGDIISTQFFDDREVERTAIVPESFRGTPLPPHDVIFNGIGEPDATRTTLACAAELLASTRARVINDPRAVLLTGRAQMMERLAGAPLIAPRTQLFSRDTITADQLATAGFSFPLLLRSPGFHAGTHFERVDDAADLPAVLARLPGAELYAIAYHEISGDDGWVRKYRVVFVDGRPYPVHLALARGWKVHYFSAAMADEPAHREEERKFLASMEAVLGADGMAALAAVNDALELDFGGVDFARDRAGRFVVFEANATMTINAPPDDLCWDYRRAAHETAIAAVRAMVRARAGGIARG